MKKFLVIALLMMSLGVQAQKSLPLNQITKEIDSVLGEINLINIPEDKPKPKKVTITFESEISKETEGGIKILFFKIGGKRSSSKASETSFSYVVIPILPLDATITQSLAIAIKNAYNEILSDSPKKMKLTGFTVKVSFTLEKSKTVEGEYEFSPITPSLSKTWTKKAVHSIEVEFE